MTEQLQQCTLEGREILARELILKYCAPEKDWTTSEAQELIRQEWKDELEISKWTIGTWINTLAFKIHNGAYKDDSITVTRNGINQRGAYHFKVTKIPVVASIVTTMDINQIQEIFRNIFKEEMSKITMSFNFPK